jgi:hypothetical protein
MATFMLVIQLKLHEAEIVEVVGRALACSALITTAHGKHVNMAHRSRERLTRNHRVLGV